MELFGSIIDNLENAAASARRLRDHPVNRETFAYWTELLQEARRARQEPSSGDTTRLDGAILKFELELAERQN